MRLAGLVLALGAAVPAWAHVGLWDEAMFGFDPNDPNQSEPVQPLMNLPFNKWWFHNHINDPPAPGKFMTLPSGGVYHGQVACNKALTKYGQNPHQQTGIYACEGEGSAGGIGAMHTADEWASPNPTDVKGCGLAIAYESDEHKVQPEDFAVISVNYNCPWFKNVDFQIPNDLPPCPPEGCLCSWGWIHSKNGGAQQMYHLVYRCKVDGATGTTPIPAPGIANKCDMPNDLSNCTIGAKQPHYWYQAERNNNPQDTYDPPAFNNEYGWTDGAQTDLFATVGGSTQGPPPTVPSSPAPSDNAPAESSTVPEAEASSSAAVPAPSPPVSDPAATESSSSAASSSIAAAPASAPSSTTLPDTINTPAKTCRQRKRALDRLAASPELRKRHQQRVAKRASRRSAALAQRRWEEERIGHSLAKRYSVPDAF